MLECVRIDPDRLAQIHSKERSLCWRKIVSQRFPAACPYELREVRLQQISQQVDLGRVGSHPRRRRRRFEYMVCRLRPIALQNRRPASMTVVQFGARDSAAQVTGQRSRWNSSNKESDRRHRRRECRRHRRRASGGTHRMRAPPPAKRLPRASGARSPAHHRMSLHDAERNQGPGHLFYPSCPTRPTRPT
jgi:hypothetical protein